MVHERFEARINAQDMARMSWSASFVATQLLGVFSALVFSSFCGRSSHVVLRRCRCFGRQMLAAAEVDDVLFSKPCSDARDDSFHVCTFFLAAGRSCRQWCPEVWLSAIAVIFLPMKSLTMTTANENRTARGLVLYAIT